jgi:DNA-binding NarL/FixJ family response regulator
MTAWDGSFLPFKSALNDCFGAVIARNKPTQLLAMTSKPRIRGPSMPLAGENSIRVLISDNSRMSSQLMAAVLKRNRTPHFEIILPSGFRSEETSKQISETCPDIALISNALQDGPFAGFSVLRKLQSENLPTRAVLLIEECERDLVLDAFRAGARGVFCRSEPSTRLARCICCVYSGQIWASNRELEYLLEELVSLRPLRVVDVCGRKLLSKREVEVVTLVADGLTNREISEQLNLSEHTVKNYLFKIFEKLGVSTRVELVLYALSQNSSERIEQG